MFRTMRNTQDVIGLSGIQNQEYTGYAGLEGKTQDVIGLSGIWRLFRIIGNAGLFMTIRNTQDVQDYQEYKGVLGYQEYKDIQNYQEYIECSEKYRMFRTIRNTQSDCCGTYTLLRTPR